MDMKPVSEIVKLLNDIPYFLMEGKLIPPRRILNDLLRRGVDDAGMSGRVEWVPFELGEDEYGAVVEELLQRGMTLSDIEPPDNVNTYEIWGEWGIVYRMGNTAEAAELADLFAAQRKLEEKRRLSEAQGVEESINQVWRELIHVSSRISEIMVNMHERRHAAKDANVGSSHNEPGEAPCERKVKLTAIIGNPATKHWDKRCAIPLIPYPEIYAAKHPGLPYPGISRDVLAAEDHGLELYNDLAVTISAYYDEGENSLSLIVKMSGQSIVQVRSPAFFSNNMDIGASLIFNVPDGDFPVEILLHRK
jgi:hypothetical protein